MGNSFSNQALEQDPAFNFLIKKVRQIYPGEEDPQSFIINEIEW